MHFGDTIFIFLLALVVFGPKKLPEIGRQIGKLMVEFRRASNDFKLQIEEELRASEQADRQKALEAQAAIPVSASDTSGTQPSIMPPSEGAAVSQSTGYARNYNNEPVEPYKDSFPAGQTDLSTTAGETAAAKEAEAADDGADGCGGPAGEGFRGCGVGRSGSGGGADRAGDAIAQCRAIFCERQRGSRQFCLHARRGPYPSWLIWLTAHAPR